MDKIIFTEEFCQPEKLHPFTLTRQMQDIRVGILTIREKWEKLLGLSSFDKKEDDYKDLERSVHMDEAAADGICFIIHGNLLPSKKLVKAVSRLKNGEFLATTTGNSIVYRVSSNEIIDKHKIKVGKAVIFDDPIHTISFPWDIFQLNGHAIREDFEMLAHRKKTQPVSKSNRVVNAKDVFICKGVRLENCIINASEGPVYIGKNAYIMDGTMIMGPCSIGEGSIIKMGTQIYGATTIGPNCIMGGEIKNSVVFGFSNKAHVGYLGDSVLGEWCNLGAGTTNSNLKNNAGDVRVWTTMGEMNAGLKCGALIGDYSRTAINSSLNTGTVIGVSCNVFGMGLTPKYIPNFSWGSEGIKRYELDKAIADIRQWKSLKNKELTTEEESIIRYIYEKY